VSSGGTFACVATCDAELLTCDGACVDPETSATHCGSCGNACYLDPHGTVSCRGGTCEVDDCGDWYDDCNDDPSDGCETPLLTDGDCGSCGDVCAGGSRCIGGLCVASAP